MPCALHRDADGDCLTDRDGDPNRDADGERDAHIYAHLHPNATRNANTDRHGDRHGDARARAVVILSDRLAVSVRRQVSRTFKVRLTSDQLSPRSFALVMGGSMSRPPRASTGPSASAAQAIKKASSAIDSTAST